MDHDRLFKELLMTFFLEFLELFFPKMVEYLDQDSIEFLDKELFTDVTQGERHEADLVVKARFREQPVYFLIHVETQAKAEANFAKRMFVYFARLHEKYDLPVYPVVLFSFDQPSRAEAEAYRIEFPDLDVLTFRFRVLQLNQLDWRDFIVRTNPIAAALMAKMRMEPTDRPEVKLACLQMLAKLQLDPARRELISGFVDSYLKLTMEEEQVFEAQLSRIETQQREQVMEIVTSWMEKGMEKGKRQEALELVLRQLRKRFSSLDEEAQRRVGMLPIEQIEQLGEALLDFTSLRELTVWLNRHDGEGAAE